jgi:Domain of unknown function (DUF4184)
VPVWLLWLKFPDRLDFLALTVGSVIPDLLEPVTLLAFPEYHGALRGWSHSFLGALTYDLALTLVATTFVVRPLLGWLDRVRPSPLWNRFGGLDYRAPKPRGWTIVSAAIGTLSHLLSDLPFHAAMPLFFPAAWIQLFPEEFDWIVGTVSTVLFGTAFAFILYHYWWLPSRTSLRAELETPR